MYLLPKPQKQEDLPGRYYLPVEGILRLSTACGMDSAADAQLLLEELEVSAGVGCSLEKGGAQEGASCYLHIDREMKDQEYRLDILENHIAITGGDETGLLYGIQTLRQIIRQEGASLPCLRIEDAPLMETRGYYHDVTRGRIPTLDSLKQLVDKLSFYKINQLQLYIEHSFLMEGFSEMWRDDTPLNAGDILELDAYCISRRVELVPSLSLFGHLYKMLKTQTYAHLGEFPEKRNEPFSLVERMRHHTLNVTLEESFETVKKMIDAYLPLFTSKKFNIGADETFDLGKGAGKAMADEIGSNRMYVDFVKKVSGYLTDRGHIPMFWGDVICGCPELLGELPDEIICLNWGYAWNQNEDCTKALWEAGATQYVCPGVCGWNQFVNLMEASFSNISRMCSYGEKYHAVGVLNTDWGDFGHFNHPECSIPGMIYGAALSWNREEITMEEMNRRISLVEYGDTSESIMEAVSALCRQSTYSWGTAVCYQEIQTKVTDWSKEDLKRYRQECSEEPWKAGEKNLVIDACREKIKACTGRMDRETRKAVYPYLLMAEGMKLFNRIGYVAGSRDGDFAPEYEEDTASLACQLEQWFHHYKALWRKVSREAELCRIGHVVFWYADYLRGLNG